MPSRSTPKKKPTKKEDLNQLRMISQRLVRAPFKHSWDFKLEIPGLPEQLLNLRGGVSTLDLLVKGISYGPITIETEAIKAGSVTLTFPIGTQPTEINLTVRDLSDGRFRRWFEAQKNRVVNSDGTFNLPYGKNGYLLKISRVCLTNPADVETWLVLPTKLGELSYDVEQEGFAEFPATFVQFNSGA